MAENEKQPGDDCLNSDRTYPDARHPIQVELRRKRRIVFLENRIKAAYHNCKAQAAFYRADAEEGQGNVVELLAAAEAYEVAANWIITIVGES